MWRFFCVSLLLFLSACARSPQASGKTHLYKLTGTVTRLDAPNQVATIKHDRIVDDQGKVWMEPMTMDFPVRSQQEFALLQPGQNIRATLHQNEANFDFWISRIEQQKP